MASAALSEEGWGGAREVKWQKNGKRAVIPVDAKVYEVVVALANACRRTHRSMNAQIYAAGLQALTGQDLDTLSECPFTVVNARQGVRALTDEDVLAVAQNCITFDESA